MSSAFGFSVDGRDYVAEWDFNALATAEQLSGVNLFTTVLSFQGISTLQYRGLLFAALQKHHPKMTLEDCGRMCRPDTLRVITNALLVAWTDAQPADVEDTPATTEGESANPQNPDGAA